MPAERVDLAPGEVLQAASVGMYRNLSAIAKQRSRGGKWGHDSQVGAWEDHIQGAICEFVVARHLGLFWSGTIGTVGSADLADNIQVRMTRHPNGRLILHPDDPDDHYFILVTGEHLTYDIHGWIQAKDGKQQQFWTDPRGGMPAFFVPRSALKHINSLPHS